MRYHRVHAGGTSKRRPFSISRGFGPEGHVHMRTLRRLLALGAAAAIPLFATIGGSTAAYADTPPWTLLQQGTTIGQAGQNITLQFALTESPTCPATPSTPVFITIQPENL